MNNNILITSVGKRVSLVNFFRTTHNQGKIFTTDLNPEMAPAGYFSDGCFKSPKVIDPIYPEYLLAICMEKQIGIVIPTIDTELLILANLKEKFAKHNINILVSDEEFIKKCRDKRLTNQFFIEKDIDIPSPIDPNNPSFPIFVKPYNGSLSKGIFIINNKDEITEKILQDPNLMFMEYIDINRYKEYTVDMYYDKFSHLKSLVPRERVEIRAGEINKGYTRKNFIVNFLKERLSYIKGVVGCICLQLFYCEDTNKIYGIEINPRFGGGYPLSYFAGANYPSFIINEYFHDLNIDFNDDWKDNTLMLRYDKEIIINS